MALLKRCARTTGLDNICIAQEQFARAAQIELLPGRRVHLNGEDVSEAIREPDISVAASRVAAIGTVRAALVMKQKQMAESTDIVMEGRDIGTVVFPDARVKTLFLDADPAERVRQALRARTAGSAARGPRGTDR